PIGNTEQQFNSPAIIRFGLALPFSNRSSIHELRNQVLTPIKISRFVDRQNMRMVESGCHSRFVLEPPSRRFIQSIGCQNLDGNRPIQLGITREIYLAHAAASEQTMDLIMTDYFPDHRFVTILAESGAISYWKMCPCLPDITKVFPFGTRC